MVRNSTHTVYYDSSNQCKVLTQCWGSAWPRVLPFCIVNVLLMILAMKLEDMGMYSFKISNAGHSFIALIVSFLLVSRVNTSVGRYNEGRSCIGQMYRETRELAQLMVLLSRRSKNNDRAAKEWRNEVAYRSMLVLRAAVAVVDYPTTHIPVWEIPELSGTELQFSIDGRRESMMRWIHGGGSSTTTSSHTPTTTTTTNNNRRRKNDQRDDPTTEDLIFLDCLRVPTRLAYLLRESIASQEQQLSHPMHIVLENKLLGNVDNILHGYYGMRKLLTTPVPFPLATMLAHCVTVFIITYGFVGLELIAIELDNPFGDDANDFDCLALAHTAFEDVYTTIRDSDGSEWADTLRYKMHDKSADPLPSEQTWLMSKIV